MCIVFEIRMFLTVKLDNLYNSASPLSDLPHYPYFLRMDNGEDLEGDHHQRKLVSYHIVKTAIVVFFAVQHSANARRNMKRTAQAVHFTCQCVYKCAAAAIIFRYKELAEIVHDLRRARGASQTLSCTVNRYIRLLKMYCCGTQFLTYIRYQLLFTRFSGQH